MSRAIAKIMYTRCYSLYTGFFIFEAILCHNTTAYDFPLTSLHTLHYMHSVSNTKIDNTTCHHRVPINYYTKIKELYIRLTGQYVSNVYTCTYKHNLQTPSNKLVPS